MRTVHFVIILSLSLSLFPARRGSLFPDMGDHFNYNEFTDYGSGTGNYSGYSEHQTVNGAEIIKSVEDDGTVSASLQLLIDMEQQHEYHGETG